MDSIVSHHRLPLVPTFDLVAPWVKAAKLEKRPFSDHPFLNIGHAGLTLRSRLQCDFYKCNKEDKTKTNKSSYLVSCNFSHFYGCYATREDQTRDRRSSRQCKDIIVKRVRQLLSSCHSRKMGH